MNTWLLIALMAISATFSGVIVTHALPHKLGLVIASISGMAVGYLLDSRQAQEAN